ncbi:MAG: histidine--tRNA ligase, partial [Candidatus Moranbacteria bacterium]|nr:histidine--tRNA ligase [Candidatus Moranbacteria bacterium]
YELFGFSPIETPAVERKEVLTSKGGNEKEIYSLARLAGSEGTSETEMALHFDLTVPLARYVAMHKEQLTFPFRRYQMQKVWRGERAQAGRYREFYQCDIDVIGRGTLNPLYDAEMPAVIYTIFRKMNIGKFVIRINNRRILKAYFEYVGVPNERAGDVLRSIDKLEKIGIDQVAKEIQASTLLDEKTVSSMLMFLGTKRKTEETLQFLKEQSFGESFQESVSELEAVVQSIRSLGVKDEYFVVDLTIARGLEYYTGTVYETVLVDFPELGSVCSGGRYDDLARFFTDEKLPGVGISIGITRLAITLMKEGIFKVGASTPASVLITSLEESFLPKCFEIGKNLRDIGVKTEVSMETGSLGKQLKYANKKGFPFVLILGQQEIDDNVVQIKDMQTGQSVVKDLDVLGEYLLGIFG